MKNSFESQTVTMREKLNKFCSTLREFVASTYFQICIDEKKKNGKLQRNAHLREVESETSAISLMNFYVYITNKKKNKSQVKTIDIIRLDKRFAVVLIFFDVYRCSSQANKLGTKKTA